MIGGTGAVGKEVVKALIQNPNLESLTLLGRRPLEGINDKRLIQHLIDIFKPETYSKNLKGHDVAICTLGVGQPSKMAKDEFIKIDKTAVYNFANECALSRIKHFELLASVGISSSSQSFYLRTKGELVDDINKLDFERFSVFQPSMILTPTNRYGLSQGILLKAWPLLKPLLIGPLKKYRGIHVKQLGLAMAANAFTNKKGTEYLEWNDFIELNTMNEH